jgi:ABC-type multidrug transport system ATPase subunit
VVNAHRLVILNHGAIAYDGSPTDLRQQNEGMSLEQAFLAQCRKSAPVKT